MKNLRNVIWPGDGDRPAAVQALFLGGLTAGLGGLAAISMALRTLLSEGGSFSGVVLPIVGSLLLEVAAVGLYRRTPNSAALALVLWIVLGVLPSLIPVWLGVVVLLPLVSAARGSYVLRRLRQAEQ